MAHAVDDDSDGSNVSDGSDHVGVTTAQAIVLNGDATISFPFASRIV